MSTASGPPTPSKPPRSALRVRDIVAAIGVLLVVVLVVGGLTRSCAFAPTGPTVDTSRLPAVDAPAELRRLASDLPFPVRVPAVPADWRANAVDRVSLPDGAHAVRAGYVTPAGRYVRLVQSDATEEALLVAEAGSTPAVGRGVVEAGGQRWVAYTGPGERAEPIWATEVAGAAPVRMLVTGSGDEADLRTLATAAVAGVRVAMPR
jgi:hypothetical protein